MGVHVTAVTDRPPNARPGLGDPAPRFSAITVAGGQIDIHVDAGRYVVLSFIGAPTDPNTYLDRRVGELLRHPKLFRDDHIVCYGILNASPEPHSFYRAIRRPGLDFLVDADGVLADLFGVTGTPWSIVLDPMMRVIASVPYSHPEGYANVLHNLLGSLPPPEQHAGIHVNAPVLIVPRVFEFELCDLLVDYHTRVGGKDSGFLLDKDGVTATVTDYQLKRRTDCLVRDPALLAELRVRIVRRLVPEIERAFSFKATRMDRYLVARYSAATGDHFSRHRDNLNAAAAHRRFAVTINLNAEKTSYEGGDLRFPEFGNDSYRPPTGGAVVFSCGLLHEVPPVTRGDRFAFLAFLYGEEDARIRANANAQLAEGERHYKMDDDLLVASSTQGQADPHK